MTATARTLRGTKRKCQNEACGLPFYDLNRDTFGCPNCQAAWLLSAVPVPAQSNRSAYGRAFKRPLLILEPALEPAVLDEPAALPAAEGDEAILETDEDEDPLELEADPEKDKED